MVTLDFETLADLDYFIDRFLDRMQQRQTQPMPKHITYQDAMKELDISDDTLTRRIKAANIRTYRRGRGKAFDRKMLYKLL